MPVSIQRWIDAQGFRNGNPFEFYEADRDPLLSSYFISPEWFDALRGNTMQPQSAILFAARGHGKSSQRRQIAHLCGSDSPPALMIELTVDECLRDAADERLERVYLRKIVQLGVEEIIGRLARDRMAASEYAQAPQRSVQLRGLQHWANPQRRLLLPPLTLSDEQRRSLAARRGVPPEQLPSDTELVEQIFEAYSSEELRQIQKDLLDLARLAGCASIYVLLDRVDEDSETEYDAAATIKRLRPLISNLNIIECPGYAFKIFLPNYLRHELIITRVGRIDDRIASYTLSWEDKDLRAMLQERLSYFSRDRARAGGSGPITSLSDLCDDTDTLPDADSLLITAARRSPRHMIRLARRLIEHHCRAAERASDLIPRALVERLLPTPLPWLRVDDNDDVWLDQELITSRLTKKDRQMLLFLWAQRGRYQKHSQISQALYNNGQLNESIDRAISRLRERLQPEQPRSRDYLDYDSLRGYRLINFEGSSNDPV